VTPSGTPPGIDPHLPARRGPLFWISAAVGWVVIGWGLRGALHHRIDTRPAELVRFFVGGAVIHDLIFAPVVLVLGVAVARLAPRGWRSYIQAALISSGLLVLFTYPEVRDYARVLHNPTSLPHNYTQNLLVVIAAVWVITAVVAATAAYRHRRQQSGRRLESSP
jgi:hypothetical protein